LKTEAESKPKKLTFWLGSVRFSVFGEKMPTPTLDVEMGRAFDLVPPFDIINDRDQNFS
jgi:hypothetical protein